MSFLGGLGKGLLKVGKMAAPALNFVPGGQFINAGIGALDTKFNQGGSWKDALKSGITSGITGGLAKGLGPSKPSIMMDDPRTGGIGGNLGGGGGGFLGGLKSMFGGGKQNTGYTLGGQGDTGWIGRDIGAVDRGIGGGGGGLDWKKVLGYGGAGLLGYGLGKMGGGDDGGDGMWGPQTQPFRPSSGGMGIDSGYDQSNPNLSYALSQGRNEARQDRGLAPRIMQPGGGTAIDRKKRASAY